MTVHVPRMLLAALVLAVSVGAAEAGQEKGDEPPQPRGKGDAGPQPAVRLAWGDHPSLRVGDVLRVDLRAGLHADLRSGGRGSSADGDAFDVTRRRLGVEGRVFEHLEFEVEREFGSRKAWRDVFLDVRRFEQLRARAGRFKLPFGMDALTSASDLEFVFRSLLARELSPGRETGLMLHGRLLGRRIAYQAGIFRHDGDNTPVDDEIVFGQPEELPLARARATAVRVSVSPFRTSARWPLLRSLRVGGAAARSEVREGENSLKGRTVFGDTFFPRILVGGQRLRLGAEAEWHPGPLSIRSEFVQVRDGRVGLSVSNEDLPSHILQGWYLSAAWRVLDGPGGKGLGRRIFNVPVGRVELLARVDRLRAGGGDPSQPPSFSPRADNPFPNADTVWTFGVNWSVNRWTRLQVNAIAERLDNLDRAEAIDRPTWRTLVCRFQFVI